MLSRTSIDEANRHLYAMHQQVTTLEGLVQQQNQALLDRDQQISELEQSKARETHTLQCRVKELEEEVHRRDIKIQQLQEDVSHIQNILQYLPCIQGLVCELEKSVSVSKLVNGTDSQHKQSQHTLYNSHTVINSHTVTNSGDQNNAHHQSQQSNKEKELYF